MEVPSTLFENFLYSPIVQESFIHERSLRCKFKQVNRFSPAETMSMHDISELDLKLHSLPLNSLNQEIERSIPFAGHIVHYGSGYYSYCYSRLISQQIWQKYFAKSPLSRSNGFLIDQFILSQGGSRHPSDLLCSINIDPLV